MVHEEDDGGYFDDDAGLFSEGQERGGSPRFPNVAVADRKVDHGRPPDAALDRIRVLQSATAAVPEKESSGEERPAPLPPPKPVAHPAQPRWVHELVARLGARRDTLTIGFGAGEVDISCIHVHENEDGFCCLTARDAKLRLTRSDKFILGYRGVQVPVTYLGQCWDIPFLPFMIMAFVRNPGALARLTEEPPAG